MAAISENYSGGTFLSDLVSRPEFLQYTSEGIFEQSKWLQSGIIQRNAALDARAGGTRVRVPFHDPINPTEEQILSNATWGTSTAGYLTPQGTTADEQIMTCCTVASATPLMTSASLAPALIPSPMCVIS